MYAKSLSVMSSWSKTTSKSLVPRADIAQQPLCYARNVKNHATFVEGFSPEFYARGRFMK